MIPLGYMMKTVIAPAPEWVGPPDVKAVHSVSNCVSSDFGDYIPLWKHNGWWFFDTPEAVHDAAASMGVDPDTMSLFYYEAFKKQWDDETKSWGFAPEDFPTQITPPTSGTLSGFDVVTFTVGTSPECSPLSCNGLAKPLGANQLCLFDVFEEAFDAVEQGRFDDSEPGPYRIIAVYSVAQ